jgi:hypothetical protein
MRKTIILAMSLVLALSLGVSGAWGNGIITCEDKTLLEEFSGAGANLGWKDVSGALTTFDTFRATYDPSSHVLTMFTNWGPGDNTVGSVIIFQTADLFLNYDPVTKTAFAAVELFGPANATTTNTVFYNPTTITNSEDFLIPSGVPGFGRNYTTNEAPATGPPTYPIPVTASGASTGTADVFWSAAAATEPFFFFSIDLDQIAGLDLKDFSFLWGTATCGNDVITCQPIPLPPTLLLLGSGLLGLGIMRRRMKK